MWDSVLVAVCLLLFFGVNLDNVLRYHAKGSLQEPEPEVPWPSGLVMGLVAAGTLMFFLESLLYLLLGLLDGQLSLLNLLDVRMLNIAPLPHLGAVLMTLGYVIFIWSVLARGRYATSWNMSTQQKLVDWGPYRYVRHPSYAGYFLMFIGFFFMWHNLLALIPFVGIPGYVLATNQEEEMLLKRFGNKYTLYRKRAGRFLPRLRSRK